MTTTAPDTLALPSRGRGRLSAPSLAAYAADLVRWCGGLKQLASTLDFTMSSRGWCYELERHGLAKGDFNRAEALINDCRKSGRLPLDFCAEDGARTFDNLETLDDSDPDEEADTWMYTLETAHEHYTPTSFWAEQPYYLQLLVEKVDLKSLFRGVCAEFRIPVANARGWCEMNCRAAMMRRFAEAEARGQRVVLLYCGDHDPKGLQISDFLCSNMADLTLAVGWDPANLIIDRFGLNRDFIDRHTLTWIDGLETGSGARLDDPHHPDYDKPYVQQYLAAHGPRKVEANALVVRPAEGRALLRETIRKYLADDAPKVYTETLAEKREELRVAILERLKTRGEEVLEDDTAEDDDDES